MIIEIQEQKDHLQILNLHMEYDDIPIMEFYGHGFRFRWYYAFTYHIVTFTLDKHFTLGDNGCIKMTK